MVMEVSGVGVGGGEWIRRDGSGGEYRQDE